MIRVVRDAFSPFTAFDWFIVVCLMGLLVPLVSVKFRTRRQPTPRHRRSPDG